MPPPENGTTDNLPRAAGRRPLSIKDAQALTTGALVRARTSFLRSHNRTSSIPAGASENIVVNKLRNFKRPPPMPPKAQPLAKLIPATPAKVESKAASTSTTLVPTEQCNAPSASSHEPSVSCPSSSDIVPFAADGSTCTDIVPYIPEEPVNTVTHDNLSDFPSVGTRPNKKKRLANPNQPHFVRTTRLSSRHDALLSLERNRLSVSNPILAMPTGASGSRDTAGTTPVQEPPPT